MDSLSIKNEMFLKSASNECAENHFSYCDMFVWESVELSAFNVSKCHSMNKFVCIIPAVAVGYAFVLRIVESSLSNNHVSSIMFVMNIKILFLTKLLKKLYFLSAQLINY